MSEEKDNVRLVDTQNSSQETSLTLRKAASDEWRLDLSKYKKEDAQLSAEKSPQVRDFYSKQNELIDSMHGISADDEEDDTNAPQNVKLALQISFAANVFLFCFKMFAAVVTGSLSVIAAALDSGLDLCSGLVLWMTSKAAVRKGHDFYNYPVGKTRFEPIGIIAFACIMGTASLQLMIEGAKELVMGDKGESASAWGEIVLAITVVIKTALYLYCKKFKESRSVQAYAMDHRNDAVMCSSLTIAVFVARWLWWLDPLGAALLSGYILFNWVQESYEHMKILVGETASPDFLQTLTYMCMNHDARIDKVDTVRAFHVGNGFFVECDVILPEEMTLKEAHDIGESLQKRLEEMPSVDRAFVHLDYEYDHKAEHEHKVL